MTRTLLALILSAAIFAPACGDDADDDDGADGDADSDSDSDADTDTDADADADADADGDGDGDADADSDADADGDADECVPPAGGNGGQPRGIAPSCVPEQCCHPTTCVPAAQAPDCSDVSCTADCQAGTMDCGQGRCECQSGDCVAVIDEGNQR